MGRNNQKCSYFHFWLLQSISFVPPLVSAKALKLQQIGSFRVLNGKVDLSTHEYELTLSEWEQKLETLTKETSARTITKEINVSQAVQTVKVLVYKNGEGRLRPGEIICGSSVIGVSILFLFYALVDDFENNHYRESTKPC